MKCNYKGAEFTYKEYLTLLRQNTVGYIHKVFNTTEGGKGEFVSNWHINYMAEYIDAVISGQIKRLVINVPPGSLKSVLFNVGFTTRVLGADPSKRIIAASHSNNLALQFSNKSKAVITSDWYKDLYPNTILKNDVENTQSFFKTTKNGYRQATSVGGKITGSSADVLVIDDPSDATEANKASGLDLTKVRNWFDTTLYSRLRDKKEGAIVLIMQRLNEGDLSQHLLDSKLDKYEHCLIPAIEETKGGKVYQLNKFKYKRKEDEYLCPQIEGKEEMDKNKERLGTIGFATQYQQRPIPKEGGIVLLKWFKTYDKEIEVLRRQATEVVQSWDTASKVKELNDYSVCTTWAVVENNYYLLDVLRKKLEYPFLKAMAISMYEAWTPNRLFIEDKASGQALIQDLKRETELPIKSINPVASKEVRFSAQSAKIEAGRVYLPNHADWLEDYKKEMITFPNGRHDDQCDSTSQFLQFITKNTYNFAIRSI